MVVRVCFVCLGNICRSPTAEAVFRKRVEEASLRGAIEIDSAGTGSWHVGEPPDGRARAAGRARGFEVGGRARQFVASDFARFDWVLAMDRSNLRALHDLAPSLEAREKVHLLRVFDVKSASGAEVPDPYYGGERGFDEVIDICEAACAGLLAEVRRVAGI